MTPDDVEQMLFDHAIRTKIVPPLAERLTNVAHSRAVTTGVVAAAALICSLAMGFATNQNVGTSIYNNGASHSTVTDTGPGKTPAYHVQPTPYPQNAEMVSASLALS